MIGPATAITHSTTKVLLVDGASGLVAGLGIGLGIIAIAAIVSDRIRRRDEVAAALGAPVELSVGKVGRMRVMRKRRLRRRLSHPGQGRRAHVPATSVRRPGGPEPEEAGGDLGGQSRGLCAQPRDPRGQAGGVRGEQGDGRGPVARAGSRRASRSDQVRDAHRVRERGVGPRARLRST